MRDWTVLPARSDFGRFSAEWDRLNSELYSEHPLFDSRFMRVLLEHFASGKELLCLHYAGGSVDGAIILHPIGLGRWQTFMPHQLPASPVLIKDMSLILDLMKALPGIAWQIDLLSLDPLYSPALSFNTQSLTSPHHKTITINVHGEFDQYFNNRPKSLQQNLRRYKHRASEEFQLIEVIDFNDESDMRDGVARFAALESSGWKGKIGTALEAGNAQERFYSELLETFSRTRQSRIVELRVDGEVAASRLIISNRNTSIFLKTTYKEDLRHIAPGRLLLQEVIAESFREGLVKFIEFYTDATRDQRLWEDSARFTRHISVFRNRSLLISLILIKLLVRPLSRRRQHAKDDKVAHDISQEVNTFRAVDNISEINMAVFNRNQSTFELAPEWFDNLHKSVYREDPGVEYFTLSDEFSGLAVLPIRKYRRRNISGFESLSNYYTSLFSPAIWPGGCSGEFEKLINAIAQSMNVAHEARLCPMDPSSKEFGYIESGFIACGWIPFRFFCFGNWYLKSPGTWNEYLATRSANFRSAIRRAQKKLISANGRLELVTREGDVDRAIDAYQTVYAKSWKRPEPHPAFVPGLIRLLAQKQALRLGIAWIDDVPIAAQIWIVYEGRASIFKLAYDENYRELSGGNALTAFLMEHVLDRDRVQEVDFLIGDDSYKRGWMSDRRERWGIVAYNPRTVVGALLLTREIFGRAIKSAWTSLTALSSRRGR